MKNQSRRGSRPRTNIPKFDYVDFDLADWEKELLGIEENNNSSSSRKKNKSRKSRRQIKRELYGPKIEDNNE